MIQHWRWMMTGCRSTSLKSLLKFRRSCTRQWSVQRDIWSVRLVRNVAAFRFTFHLRTCRVTRCTSAVLRKTWKRQRSDFLYVYNVDNLMLCVSDYYYFQFLFKQCVEIAELNPNQTCVIQFIEFIYSVDYRRRLDLSRYCNQHVTRC